MSAPLVALALSVALLVAAWVVSVVRRDASVVDVFWGLGFVVAAWTYHATTAGAPARQALVVTLVTIWGLRLSLHILRRSIGRGEDFRYAEMRRNWGKRFPWVSLFTIFLLQAAILWAVSLPLWQAQRSAEPASLGALDAVGTLVFLVGLFFETVGDEQLRRFKADPANRGKVMDRGLWRYTRHPNYFGDAAVWWGLFLIAFATPGSAWTVYAPLAMTVLLLRVSGVTLLEKTLSESRPGYREYMERTSSFFPLPPRSSGK